MVCIYMFIQLFFQKNAALMLLVGGIIVERTATELFDILGLRFYHSVFWAIGWGDEYAVVFILLVKKTPDFPRYKSLKGDICCHE